MKVKDCKFELKEKVKTNIFNILVKFEGGDADTSHYEVYEIEGVTALNYTQPSHWSKVDEQLEIIKAAKQVLSNGKWSSYFDYEATKEEWGKEIADFCDDIPSDPQADYQFKCYIDSIILQYYDSEGNLFNNYVN